MMLVESPHCTQSSKSVSVASPYYICQSPPWPSSVLPDAMTMGVRHLRGGEVLRSSALAAQAASGRVAEPDPHHPAASAEPPTTSRGLRAAARPCAGSAP